MSHVLLTTQVPMARADHPMFGLGLSHREARCSDFLSWVNTRLQHHRAAAHLVAATGLYAGVFSEYKNNCKTKEVHMFKTNKGYTCIL